MRSLFERSLALVRPDCFNHVFVVSCPTYSSTAKLVASLRNMAQTSGGRFAAVLSAAFAEAGMAESGAETARERDLCLRDHASRNTNCVSWSPPPLSTDVLLS